MTIINLRECNFFMPNRKSLMLLSNFLHSLKISLPKASKFLDLTLKWVAYVSKELQRYLQNKGIISQRTCPYTPQQNGVGERKNRRLLDVALTLLI